MVYLWLIIRITLLGYERIAGKKIATHEDEILSSWAFFFFSFMAFFPFFNYINLMSLKAAIFSGSIYSLSFFLYVYALANEDASVIAPLYNMNVIFLIITTAIFLDEKITITKILGSLLMLYGVSYLKKDVNLKESYKNIFKSKGAVAMLLSSILMAIGRTIDGYFVKNVDSLSYSISIYLIVSIYFFIVTMIKYKSIKPHISIIKRKISPLISGGISNAYSYIALLNMFKYIDVSIAEPVSMSSALITAFFAKVIFKEKVAIRILGTILLILGAFIIYL
ncbi:DMT family transporter [Marinitoga lauensis]|uniref:DMT family transporter n=1 Tax=Marinitoga lauensis TaxID=2201189 RepID=UPI001011023B|nr:DMT family transporter [Marinitoga lauensis]